MRVSEDAASFDAVYRKLLDVMDDVRAGRVTVDQGDVMAKAGFGAAKVLESDLHARMFEHKLAVRMPMLSVHPAKEAA